jgi:hypothetical protein
VIEGHIGRLGGQRVLLDGELVSRRPLAGLLPSRHVFTIVDETGVHRRVEVRWSELHDAGVTLRRTPMVVAIDGEQRCVITASGHRLEGLLEQAVPAVETVGRSGSGEQSSAA